jgi:transcriptional regulator with XRE-family HTH domain
MSLPCVMKFAVKLRYLRSSNGYSMDSLSAHTGISRTVISDLENGKKSNPRRTEILKLCDCFHVTADYLIRDNAGINDNVEQKELFYSLNNLSRRDQQIIRSLINLMTEKS